MALLALLLVVLSCVLVAVSVATRLGAERRLREVLARRSVQITTSTFAPDLELRTPDGIVARRLALLTLGSATPLTAPELLRCSVVEVPLAASDVVVCRHGIAQAVFGAFLPPRIATGDATFDAEFGVFEPPTAPGAYRGSGPTGGLAWATPDVLAALRASGFVAMQITGGQARIATAEARGRAPQAPLVHHLDIVDLARLRAVATDPRAQRPALPAGPAPSAPRFALWEMAIVFSVELPLLMMRLRPDLFGLESLVCPDGGVFEDRRRSTLCRLSPTSTYAPDLGSLTALVFALAIAFVAGRLAWHFFRQNAYLTRLVEGA